MESGPEETPAPISANGMGGFVDVDWGISAQ